MEYTDLLRRLALQDERFVAEISRHESPHAAGLDQFLDPRTLALMRLAALVAVGGAVPSYGAHVDAAVDAGATSTEIAEVLVAVLPVVGLPRVVAAAPRLALALGHDLDDAVANQPE